MQPSLFYIQSSATVFAFVLNLLGCEKGSFRIINPIQLINLAALGEELLVFEVDAVARCQAPRGPNRW